MLNEPRFDFSKETNIKIPLWEKMNAAVKTPMRKSIAFDELDPRVINQPKIKTASIQGNGKTAPVKRGKPNL
ncbi:MAG: hypothetical protein FWE90_10355 [Defluviitaleaceae bacterium]|nr:hypothetical protein [Defluviitaleaceae bacterium]